MVAYPPVQLPSVAAEVLLGVNDQSLSTSEGLFEEGVSRRKRHPVVTALDDEVNGGQHRLHLGEPGPVMAEEVGAGQVGEGGEGAAGGENGGHDVLSWS
jgi:hypothetical protein